jgi:hypothetical protein
MVEKRNIFKKTCLEMATWETKEMGGQHYCLYQEIDSESVELIELVRDVADGGCSISEVERRIILI